MTPETDTRPGDVDTAPAEPVAGDPPSRWSRPSRSELASWAGDALALLLLAGVLLYWEVYDGGRHRDPLVHVGVVALLTVPLALREAARLPRVARLGLGGWGLGWIVAFAFAVDRHDWVTPTLILAIVPLVGLSARRVWRRPWGPLALLGLFLVSFGMYTYRTFLQWWGGTMLAEFQPLWMPLSWRNQSGALMAAFGLLFLGVAWSARRVVRGGMALLAGAAFAGVWLSSSRGAIAFGALALVVMLAGGLVARGRAGRSSQVLTVVAGLLAAGIVVAGLQAMLSPDDTTPLASRAADGEAGTNAALRLHHMRAALRMFADRPLTGQGAGSYEIVALDFTDPDANLTSSAHDQYVEVLGEGGLVAGVPFLLLHVAVAVAVWRRLRRGLPDPDPDAIVDVRGAMLVGLLGAGVMIAAHSAFDFDWDYAVLPSILAMAAGAWSVRQEEEEGDDPSVATPGWTLGAVAVVPLALLLAGTLAGHVAERHLSGPSDGLSPEAYATYGAPWDAELRADIATDLLRDGHLELAREAVDSAVRWNPGVDRLRRIQAIVRYEQGELDGPGLVATLEPGRSRFTSYLDIGLRLAQHGEDELAAEVLDDVQEQMSRYGNWGVNRTVVDVGMAQIAIAGKLGGCEAARAEAAEVRALPAAGAFSDIDLALEQTVEDACAG